MITKKTLKKKFQVDFSAEKITPFSGILPFSDFWNKLNISDILDSNLTLNLHHNTLLPTSKIIQLLVLSVLSGGNRVSKAQTFSYDVLVQELLNLKSTVDENSIHRRLNKFNMLHYSGLFF